MYITWWEEGRLKNSLCVPGWCSRVGGWLGWSVKIASIWCLHNIIMKLAVLWLCCCGRLSFASVVDGSKTVFSTVRSRNKTLWSMRIVAMVTRLYTRIVEKRANKHQKKPSNSKIESKDPFTFFHI